MQVQSVSNINSQNNFTGRVIIVDELSAIPNKMVRKSAEKLKQMVADKSYDLFIRENPAEHTVSVIAQKEKDFGKANKLQGHVLVSKTVDEDIPDVYELAAEHAFSDYENKLESMPENFKEKCKNFFKKAGKKFLEVMQDED